jgi:hypothetical protein
MNSTPQWLLALLNIKIHFEGIRIVGHQRHSEKCDDKAEGIRTKDFHKCFQQWQHGWAEHVITQEYYFESKPFRAVLSTCIQEYLQ